MVATTKTEIGPKSLSKNFKIDYDIIIMCLKKCINIKLLIQVNLPWYFVFPELWTAVKYKDITIIIIIIYIV